VEVDDDDRCGGARLLDEGVDDLPRGDRRGEEELAEQVQDPDTDTVSRLNDGESTTRGVHAGVRRADHPLAFGEICGDSAAPVRVVAEGDHVCPRREQLVGELRRDAGSLGRVLAVDDREVSVIALA
jgi:hypothetical protein